MLIVGINVCYVPKADIQPLVRPPDRGSTDSVHLFGTRLPVEEPKVPDQPPIVTLLLQSGGVRPIAHSRNCWLLKAQTGLLNRRPKFVGYELPSRQKRGDTIGVHR